MTFNTNSYNIKTVLTSIAWMMVLFCFFVAPNTQESIWTRHLSASNSNHYLGTCFGFSLMCWVIAFTMTYSCLSSFITYVISAFGNLAFFTVTILSIRFSSSFGFAPFSGVSTNTRFALVNVSIFHLRMFVEIRKWFNLLTAYTWFCYDCLRHYRFSYKRSMFRAICGLQSIDGLLYHTESMSNVNLNLKYILTG